MISYIGDFAEDETIYHYFNTFDSNDPSASVTITNLADTDIYVYKDGSVTNLVTDGASAVIDFDARTGVHKLTIDTSVSADYAIGSDYMVLIEGTTIDAGTVTAGIFTFSIENRYNAAADDLANATDGLGALKTLIDAIQTDLDNGTDGLGAIKTVADTIAADVVNVDGYNLATQIGTAGAGLTNLGGSSNNWNTVVPDAAGVAATPAEVATALTDIGLDHLLAASVTGTDITDNSIIAKMVDNAATADWDNFDNTAESLSAIAAAGATDPWGVALPGSYTVGEAGYILGHQVDQAGTCQAGSTASTVKLASGAVGASDDLNGNMVYIISGTGAGQAPRTITDSTITTDVCNINPDWVTTPDGTTTYQILPANNGSLQVDASGYALISDGTGTGQISLTAGAIDNVTTVATTTTNTDMVTEPPTTAEIADAVWDEPVAGHVGAGTFGKTDADILADTNDLQTNQGAWATASGFATNTKQDTMETTLNAAATTAELDKVPKSDGAVYWNATALAAIESENNDALVAYGAATASALTTVDTVVDAIKVVTDALGSAGAANLALSAAGIIGGVAATGTLSTTVCTSDLSGYLDDELINRVIVFTGGTADGQAATITDYSATNGTVTFSGGITTAPANADTFVIV